MSSQNAVFVVVHPGALPYLDGLVHGLRRQTVRGTTVLVALSGVSTNEADESFRPAGLDVEYLETGEGAPAEVRNRALAQVAPRFSALVLQDADDVPHATRVEGLLAALEGVDVCAHALRLVDASGGPLGRVLSTPSETADDMLPRMNVFGFGNSAYRSAALQSALPAPPSATAVDWYVATKAWLQGAALRFIPAALADYRQHPGSTTRVYPPFTQHDVARAADVSQRHLASLPDHGPRALLQRIEERRRSIDAFRRWWSASDENVALYLGALNADPRRTFAWWECAAITELEHLWSA